MATCDICGNKISLGKFKYKFKSGQVIDNSCRERLDLPNTVTKYKEDFDNCKNIALEQMKHEAAANGFEPTTIFGERFAVNDNNQTFVVYPIKVPLFKSTPACFNYKELKSFDVIEDGNTVKGGLGRAAVGGLALGGAGAVVGAVTGKTKKTISEYKVKLNLDNLLQPYYVLSILDFETKKNSAHYREIEKSMNDTIAGIQHILEVNNSSEGNSTSDLDDLRKLKSLLDDSIITQEEFDTKKKQILGI